MSFPKRLKEIRKIRGCSQSSLARKLGVEQNTVWRWENSKTTPDIESIKRVARALETSISYLVGETDDPAPAYEGAPVRVQAQVKETDDLPESNIHRILGPVVRVPVLSRQASVCCGKGFILDEDGADVDWWEPVPESWLTGPQGDRPFFITYVEGDSMEPLIEDGERILINPNQEVRQGDIAVVCWDGRSMVRGIIFERSGDIRLVPSNKEKYEALLISKEDTPFVLNFVGVVLRFLGKDRVSHGIL